MPRFRYRAISPSGQVSEGDMLAESRREVVARIQALGHVPMLAEELVESGLRALLTADLLKPRHASRRSIAPLIRQLGTLLRAGLPLDRSLEVLHEVTDRRADAEVPRRLLAKIRGGSALADAMAAEPLFPAFCVSMVRAGEVSGALEAVLERLAEFLEKSQAAKAKIRSAMLYPAIVLVASLASLFVLFGFVVPRFRPFFEDAHARLPLVTRALLATGDLFQQFWWLPPLLLAALALAITAAARDPERRHALDALVLRLPLFGELARKIEIAHFSRILGTLLKNGVPLTHALKIAGETIRNRVLAKAINAVAASVKEGKGLAEPLAQSRVVPPLALRLVRVGEEAARLDDMLLEVATIYDWETNYSIERLLSLLGPALTIGLGGLVALVIGSIMMTVLSVYRLAI